MGDERARAIEECVGQIDAGIRESIEILGAEILDINRANGWNVTTPEQFGEEFESSAEYALPACLATVHRYLSEALEAYRKQDACGYSRAIDGATSILVDLGDADGDFAVPLGFDSLTNSKIPAVLALIHSEVSEALEGFVASDKDNFAEEMADVVIRVIDCTAGLGVDLGSAILAKLEKNRGRGFRHGGKVV